MCLLLIFLKDVECVFIARTIKWALYNSAPCYLSELGFLGLNNFRILSLLTSHYSVLKLFTGLATAAFIAWKLTVNTVIINAPTPATAKIHHDNPVRYW